MRTEPQPRRRRRVGAVGLALLAAAAPLSACTEVESETPEGYEPVTLEAVPGSEDRKRVTFTAEGARRTGVETARVRRSGRRLVVPYAALLYDPDGSTYVYTSAVARTYLRAAVEVDRIAGRRVLLTRGPAPGTPVVTTGAAEVRGAELDIAGGH